MEIAVLNGGKKEPDNIITVFYFTLLKYFSKFNIKHGI